MDLERDVDISKYWPSVIGDMREFKQISIGENPEYSLTWNAIDRLINDSFVGSASDYALTRWEKIYGITRYPADTLEQRRSRILATMARNLPYTMRTLRILISSLVGDGNYKATVNPVTMTLTVLVNVRASHQMDDVRSLLEAVVPANLSLTLSHLYSPHNELASYTHEQLASYTHKYIKETLST